MRWRERIRRLPRPLRLLIGIVLIILGLLGLFLPILQGILFLTLGVAVLSYDVPLFGRWVKRAQVWWRARKRRNRFSISPHP